MAEALRTQGLIYCRVKKYSKAKRALEDADRLARRCGDVEGAARALIVLAEEMCDLLDIDERRSVATRLNRLLADSEQPSINRQVRRCLERIRNSEHRLT